MRAGLDVALRCGIVILSLGVTTKHVCSRPAPVSGAQTLCITYRCAPINRAKIIRQFEHTIFPRIEQWCAGDSGRHARMLVATVGSDANPWDVMLLLRFGSPARMAAWCTLEKTMPAGLLPDELDGIEEVRTTWMDVLAEHAAPFDDRTLVLVRPYGYTDPDLYPDYVRAYLAPELEAWRTAGALAGFSVLVNRLPGGSAWDILLVQQYHDAEALSRREAVRGSTIDSLRANPAWLMLHESKDTYRITNQPQNISVIARPILSGSER